MTPPPRGGATGTCHRSAGDRRESEGVRDFRVEGSGGAGGVRRGKGGRGIGEERGEEKGTVGETSGDVSQSPCQASPRQMGQSAQSDTLP